MPDGAVLHPIFQPAKRTISSITNSSPAVIVTAQEHNYLDSDIVRILIPTGFGMAQMNQKVGDVTVINNTTFSVNIDSSSFDTFSIPGNNQYAQVIPIGSRGPRFEKGAKKNTLPSLER